LLDLYMLLWYNKFKSLRGRIMDFNENSFFNKLTSIVFAIALVVLIISFSIGIPIYFRPFYYMHIDALDIEESTGASKEELIEAYDELLDYLTLGKEFGVGVFKYSESGKDHFYDCKKLFDLNLFAFIISASLILLISIVNKVRGDELWAPFGLHISFFAGILALLAFAAAGIFIVFNFKTAFLIFHTLLFPGKTNWYFDYDTDPIIRALPNQFFMNAAIVIISSIIILCLSLIIYAIRKRRKEY